MTKNIYIFSDKQTDGNKELVNILGGKGSNLAEMCNLKIPVPPGFTISSDVCNYYLKNHKFPSSFKSELLFSIKKIEKNQGSIFGDSKNPLLFSIRSGARTSMPGMMETVLNVGLGEKTLIPLIEKTNNARFVYDSYRRLIMMYSDVVMDKALQPESHKNIREKLDLILMNKKTELNIENDSDLPLSSLKEICDIFKKEIKNTFKEPFPDNPFDQLWGSIEAVFKSWNGVRAKKYRQIENIPDDWGTAVNIQSMVFGNMGEGCGTGVAFTRNPSTGENNFYGEWLPNAQGEDVVAGIRTPYPINEQSKNELTKLKETLENKFPLIYSQLLSIKSVLENHYNDMQDIEFTIQNQKLYMLQTRRGKRTGASAINIALDYFNKNKIDVTRLIKRLETKHFDEIMHPYFNPGAEKSSFVLTTGLPAGPGCAVGQAVFTSEAAENWAARGMQVVLIREETSPEDIHGMHASKAIITTRGGMTSHAALVARGWGKCCVVGSSNIAIDTKNKTAQVNNKKIKQGDWVSVNGTEGKIYLDKLSLIDADLEKNENFKKILNICIKNKKIGVRSNSDTPDDARVAKSMGAKGIGLCRTEHMFFNPKRISEVRKMILFRSDDKIRKKALMNLLPFQKQDFYEILKTMSPFPVTIRLLDPPLHEFLPQTSQQISSLANETKCSIKEVESAILQLHESNPMLGHRGCRLGISYPEITQMQAGAILEASHKLSKEGIKVNPEIMIPLVGSLKEFLHQRKVILECSEDINLKNKRTVNFKIGTMIELPRACLIADRIAKYADFISFGTNDLTQTTYGFSRDDVAPVIKDYFDKNILKSDPFQTLDQNGVGELIKLAVQKARKTKPDIKIGICGEHGGDPKSIEFFKKRGFNYVSCSSFRVPAAILSACK
ncbi:MAG: pyruvate, phosphate dikinase [Candidatus Marinimicrobia bacterium]|nr:pyruvate, phosphate dikinase [Candidatus Neomarinimicrobiota bacterium]|tara:strand:+ start:20573 stop:23254 length:2682 start_codon:yes stop_codon:yes gene_type:complete